MDPVQTVSLNKRCCSKCTHWFPVVSFYLNSRSGVYSSMCKGCHKVWRDARYQENREVVLAKQNKRRKEHPELHRGYLAVRRKERQDHVWAYLLEHPCMDCGETDPVVLEFDHLRDKVCSVSKLITDGAAMSRLRAEIAKCEVVCANCHRRRTYKRNDGWRYRNGSHSLPVG